MRVLLTGISGFVGVRLAPRLVERGDRVVGIYVSERPPVPDVELIEADLRDAEAVAEAVERSGAEAVVHLAGLSHVGESWSRMHDYFAVNVLGSEHVLAASAGRRVLVASSAEVYGLVPEEEQPIAEERPLAPQSPYALTKAAVERLAAPHGALVVRSFNLVGPGQAGTFALPSFAHQLAEIRRGAREPVLEVGNLAARRDFLHVDDAVAAFETLLNRGGRGETYNLGGGEALPVGRALEMLVEVSGVKVSTRVSPERWRPVDLPLLRADCTRLERLGWKPRLGLRRALEDLWRSVAGDSASAAG